MPDFGALYLEFEKLNNKGLGKLIKNGYIGTEKIAIPTRWNTNPSKQVYFLTEKGSDLLTSVGIKPTTKGPYTKKASELRHDLLVGQVFRNELQKAFLEGRKIHEIKTDHDLRAESASKVETLHRTIMKKTGFSKEDLIELSRLEKKQKKAP